MKKSNKFSPEVRERAVRLVQEHRGEYPSLWAAIESIAPKIGCVPQTLNEWVKRAEVDAGVREGVTTSEAQRVKDLEREVKELRRANEILKLASAFFAPGGARPPAQVLKDFIDQHREAFGVEPLCKVLQVAPSAYRRHAALLREPHKRCARALRDEALAPEIQRVWQANMQVYGADKVWRQLAREGVTVARCTVERLMRRMGLRGVMRGKVVRTTIGDAKALCPLDRVNRQFRADRPNQLWVSDFTYVSTWQGWLYVAFVIDVFARRIIGWRVSSFMRTDFVLDALEQALYARQPERDGSLICHSDRGSQYVSIRYSERLAEAGIEPSVGSKGDSYDNALAETINGLYKAELIHRRAPWKTKESVEFATLEWVSWFNHHRLLEPIGYIPPAEAEANYYRQLASQATAVVA
ncbi:IS3 family transposase [Xanthomonas campestris pv. trichodesmae]|uniref:IS3 family transposase n=2 Tax=Xanthomonas citri TaxID=346 RepID=A0AB33CCA6_XANCI|nr:IS3 family transposase [Xanthomonas citri]MBV6783634.1 IS3 family transposase [Xanthomonas campestris pv. trichodesmae]ASK90714.1 IS3 family transposase [Xanthomonas citri pv. vignicola]ASK91934.1 IS3 family transposase [Xanthomonas citri pv. vignicola]ASK92301.1 IS3 family transposase [Xanthomonas citri pv. vignicola]ASK92435.1 IS3 family transposase [Xanthomonas citri pv. vignicola]